MNESSFNVQQYTQLLTICSSVKWVFWDIKIAGAICAAGDLSMNSRCYRKFLSSPQTWYSASNDCLFHGESLAVFADIGHPSDNSQLTAWLNDSGTDKSYWIGFIRSWWKTTDKGECYYSCYTITSSSCTSGYLKTRVPDGYWNGYPGHGTRVRADSGSAGYGSLVKWVYKCERVTWVTVILEFANLEN